MANYDYVTVKQIDNLIERAACSFGGKERLESNRGHVIFAEWQEWRAPDGGIASMLSITTDHSGCSIRMGEQDSMVKAFWDILIALNCKLKTSEYGYLTPFKDIVLCNNPNHELYGKIITLDGSIIY